MKSLILRYILNFEEEYATDFRDLAQLTENLNIFTFWKLIVYLSSIYLTRAEAYLLKNSFCFITKMITKNIRRQ